MPHDPIMINVSYDSILLSIPLGPRACNLTSENGRYLFVRTNPERMDPGKVWKLGDGEFPLGRMKS
jgi:hypothetical protein